MPSEPASGIREVSSAARFALGPDVAVEDEGDRSGAGGSVVSATPSVFAGGGCSAVGEPPDDFFFSLSWASKPSTRLSKASSTSVLGPRFLGTASAKVNRTSCQCLYER